MAGDGSEETMTSHGNKSSGSCGCILSEHESETDALGVTTPWWYLFWQEIKASLPPPPPLSSPFPIPCGCMVYSTNPLLFGTYVIKTAFKIRITCVAFSFGVGPGDISSECLTQSSACVCHLVLNPSIQRHMFLVS